jgi:virginiamycin A acetyltransferase
MPEYKLPHPNTKHPVILPDGTAHTGTVFLNAAIDHPRMEIGDYSYASARVPPVDWSAHLAPYLYPHSPEKLTIGKFCQIADGVTIITSSANHRYDGFSSFPFAIFQDMDPSRPSMPNSGPNATQDTTIGHDVWIGQGATILPGARIGHGAIVGARSVVAGAVPPYTIIAGNPAKPIRSRFDKITIEALLEIAWWHWPTDKVVSSEAAICGADLDALQKAASTHT